MKKSTIVLLILVAIAAQVLVLSHNDLKLRQIEPVITSNATKWEAFIKNALSQESREEFSSRILLNCRWVDESGEIICESSIVPESSEKDLLGCVINWGDGSINPLYPCQKTIKHKYVGYRSDGDVIIIVTGHTIANDKKRNEWGPDFAEQVLIPALKNPTRVTNKKEADQHIEYVVCQDRRYLGHEVLDTSDGLCHYARFRMFGSREVYLKTVPVKDGAKYFTVSRVAGEDRIFVSVRISGKKYHWIGGEEGRSHVEMHLSKKLDDSETLVHFIFSHGIGISIDSGELSRAIESLGTTSAYQFEK